MDEFIKKICAKTGISEDQAKQVFQFLREHADEIPEWLGKVEYFNNFKKKLPGGLGDLF